ncbi:MAG: amidohydrolase, partial [Balneolaceae bacterium]
MTESLFNLRKHLHQHPELSGQENRTAEFITKELKKRNPDEILEGLGGTGVVAIFRPSHKENEKDNEIKKRILFRAELDAIAVSEETQSDYGSQSDGVMHGCGHDGHMAILIGLAQKLSEKRPDQTEVILLFQPAEETGEGAISLLNDERFQKLKIDCGFALHNLPGFKEGTVILRDGTFACASVGVEITFIGKSSHAAYPEQGTNPARSLISLTTEILDRFEKLNQKDPSTIVAVTFAKMGEEAFGISPGRAKMGFTIRSASDQIIRDELKRIEGLAESESQRFGGEIRIKSVEPFAATVNDKSGNQLVERAAKKLDLKMEWPDEPFPWSEDFGRFREKFPITLFGLGAG